MGDDHDGLSVDPERFPTLNVENLTIGWATRMVRIAQLLCRIVFNWPA